MGSGASFDELLWVLQKGRLDERRCAYWELSERTLDGLDEASSVRLLEWAAQPLPPIGDFDVPSALIAAAALRPCAAQVEVVQRIYSRLPSRRARTHALDLLNGLPTRAAAEAYAGLLHDYDPRHALDSLALGGLFDLPRHPGVFFPLLFRWADHAPFRREVLDLTLEYARASLLDAPLLGTHAEPWLTALAGLSPQVRAAAGLRGEHWRWRTEYQPVRATMTSLLALTGYLPLRGATSAGPGARRVRRAGWTARRRPLGGAGRRSRDAVPAAPLARPARRGGADAGAVP